MPLDAHRSLNQPEGMDNSSSNNYRASAVLGMDTKAAWVSPSFILNFCAKNGGNFLLKKATAVQFVVCYLIALLLSHFVR